MTTIAASDWSRCFLLSGSEAVTKADAEVLCAFHNGAWVAEIDRPGKDAEGMFIENYDLQIINGQQIISDWILPSVDASRQQQCHQIVVKVVSSSNDEQCCLLVLYTRVD